MHNESTNHLALPCVVQLGFAGSRRLFDESIEQDVQQRLAANLTEKLTARVRRLAIELKLTEHHFLCGISQMAIGADMTFSDACRQLQIPHRVFLPQTRDEFLAAEGSSGSDFDATSKKRAEALLESDHVIQERVVTTSPDRGRRFEDTALEILRVADVVVCLMREDAEARPGGTARLLERAMGRGKTILELRVCVSEGMVTLSSTWHGLDNFVAPTLPAELEGVAASDTNVARDIEAFSRGLREFTAAQARRYQKLFRYSASIIIFSHLFATVCAVVGLLIVDEKHFSEFSNATVSSIQTTLGVLELILLITGISLHQYVHRWHVSKNWAFARLIAEVTRSVLSVSGLRLYLHYLFTLQLPNRLKPLLRTLNVLHLESTRSAPASWEARRDLYIANRVGDQIAFYEQSGSDSGYRFAVAAWTFSLCSLGAISVTLANALAGLEEGFLRGVLVTLGIVLPALAVGSLSLSASMDLEARTFSFAEVRKFLEEQKPHLEAAASQNEFEQLVLDTEAHLLAENVGWFVRRSALGV